jgi:hypothetical protein
VSNQLPASCLIPDGRDLLELFAELFAAPGAWVLANGYVEDVELRVVASAPEDAAESLKRDDAAKSLKRDTRRVLKGRSALAQLSGPVGGPYGVTLSHSEGGRVEVVAGMLVRARSAGVNAYCLGAPSAPVSTPELRAASGPVPAISGNASWAEQAQAAVQASAEPESEEAEPGEPERGDLIQHFAFGLCEVLNVSGDRLLIRDLARTGRVREIHTEMLVVHPPVERDGKRLFQLSRRG